MGERSRRDFLRLSAGAVTGTALGSPGAASQAVPTAANFLMLKSDEHNPRISSIEGHPFIQTPNMERLASRGVVFENHYCPSPLCCPSRSSFISGRRVHEIQTYNNCGVFKSDYPSYGKILHEQGVHTAFFGKLDVYNWPDQLGFSEMYGEGTRDPGDINIRRQPVDIRQDGSTRQDGYGLAEDPFKRDEATTEQAIRWLKERAPILKKPWTLEVNLVKPHFPHRVTQELWELYGGHEDLPEIGLECEPAWHPMAQDLRRHFQTEAFTESSVRGLRRGYYGCVTFIDRQLGRILDVLEETGVGQNTVIAYTSDHGEMLGKFGMWWKCSLYEDSARVPLIIAGPGFGENSSVRTPVDQLDLQASIFRATGRRRPDSWSGQPLQEIDNSSTGHVAFCEYHGHGTRASSFMVRRENWKYIFNYGVPHQLFNLENDPNELHNLAWERKAVVEMMDRELRKICNPEEEQSRAERYVRRELKAVGRG